MLPLLLSLLIPAATGVLLLRLVWPRDILPWSWPLGITLGAGVGVGLFATVFFLWMLAFGATRGLLLVDVAAFISVAIATAVRRGRRSETRLPVWGAGFSSRAQLLLGGALLLLVAAAAGAFLATLRHQPHGEWDAWMNWNLRARMIFRGGAVWTAAFSDAIPWSHPDYPVLVPSLVVRSWLYAGRETLRGPALVAAGFTFGTAMLLITALGALRSSSHGVLAGLILLSTPFFIVHGTSLYADVPVGFYFLATIVCLALDGRCEAATVRFAVVGGIAAGLSMWTKNEGLLFTLAVGTGLGLAALRHGQAAARRRLGAFGAGVLPFLLLTAGFKIAYAPPNDLLSTLGIERTLGNLTNLDRYAATLRAYATHIPQFGSNGFGSGPWVVAVVLLGLGISREELARRWAGAAAAGLALLLAGHFMVFVSMAHELQRLLNSSLDRLLLQLWPSALCLAFMVIATLEEPDTTPGVSADSTA
jgi:hypothetical protein